MRKRSTADARAPLPYGRGSDRTGCRASVRVGLLATQGIRGGDNRTVLERIKQTGDISMAWSDREWILDGANVHVSMIGFDDGTEQNQTLDGHRVSHINADLTADVDTTARAVLAENGAISFMGDTKQGDFDVPWGEARKLLAAPSPNRRANSEVVRPWVNGLDITRRPRSMWIVDFPDGTPEAHACGYEAPYEYVRRHVKPWREANRKSWFRAEWWVHYAPRPDMRSRIERLPRFVATARLAKHRVFTWLSGQTLPDCQLIAFARADDYFFGVLHSSIHELWSLRMGTQLEDRPRYTPTTCFETFPLPWPPGGEPGQGGGRGEVGQASLPATEAGTEARPTPAARPTPEARPTAEARPTSQGRPCFSAGEVGAYQRIAAAAKELNEQRENWLNPPEWIEALGRGVDREDDFADVPAEARPLLRWSAIMALAAQDSRFKKRTLTNLYNERPTWLRLAHEKLDRAVLAAYTAVDPEGGWSEGWAEVWIETGAGQPLPEGHPLAVGRTEIDQRVLANLLRMNLERAPVR